MKANYFTLLTLLLAATACTQDELISQSGEIEGKPMIFTATGLTPAAVTAAPSRATVDGDWEGVTTVAVKIGDEVKEYTATASDTDGYKSATLTSDDPHYWTKTGVSEVLAWWPYTAGETTPPAVVVKANQSEQTAFEGSDFISAENQRVNYGSPTLRFTHRTALVHIVLTDYTEGLDSVKLTNLSTSGENPAKIIPYDKGGYTYSALVAPQEVTAGTAFVTCTFDNGKAFVYKIKETTQWIAGEEYTYTVSLVAAGPGYTYDETTHTYIVYTDKGLLAWNEAAQSDPTLNCTLAADIDLTAIDWTPVGNYDTLYTGTFDGGGHTITGLTINLPNQQCVGLIGSLGSSGTVQDLTMDKGDITGGNFVGGVVGRNSGTVTGCTSSATVEGGEFVGGVVGHNYGGTVTGCTATGDVSGTGNSVGGVVGYNFNGGTVTGCYATGDVSGTNSVGGVVGENFSGTVTGCYATGKVSGTNRVGSVVGCNDYDGTVTGCYWSDYDGNGIGDGSGSGETTKVNGTDVTWENAQSGMNIAIDAWNNSNPNKPCNWHYEGATATTPPTLVESSNP